MNPFKRISKIIRWILEWLWRCVLSTHYTHLQYIYMYIYMTFIVCIKRKNEKNKRIRTMVKIRIIIFVCSHYYYGWLSSMARHKCCKNACELERYIFWIHTIFVLSSLFFCSEIFSSLSFPTFNTKSYQISLNFVLSIIKR